MPLLLGSVQERERQRVGHARAGPRGGLPEGTGLRRAGRTVDGSRNVRSPKDYEGDEPRLPCGVSRQVARRRGRHDAGHG